MHIAFFSLALSVLAATVAQQLPDKCDCSGTFNTNDTRYVCGDFRLGPVYLPSISPIGSGILYKYDSFNGACPGTFLHKWTWPNGSYHYPEPMGFQNSTSSKPIEGLETLPVGTLIDRFGATSGMYLSPAFTPFRQRALPPQALNPPRSGHGPAADYHVYRVEKPLTVLVGTITAWFGQPGQGTQYFLCNGTHQFRVVDLLGNTTHPGYLSEVAVKEDE
ncbi:hypothetical protein FB45DRAFT_834975 [Roridomyces roridus]|uniref:TNT domain-containing protein n=1 Tax=Roridomyces roridus TaxID=1738132 RepID=A0AAD7BSE0_9AGAR|nr:hypothetical protein FB45DRAFT_834975 [Roridomyces roridus]